MNNRRKTADNIGFASVFAFKHCAKNEHSDKAKNRTQSHETLCAINERQPPFRLRDDIEQHICIHQPTCKTFQETPCAFRLWCFD